MAGPRLGVPGWDAYFLQIAEVVKLRSKDPNTQIGAVVVDEDNQIVATGYNGFPRGAQDVIERFERPMKYDYFEHAERNAIYAAARRGAALKGCRLYLSGPHFSCLDCTRAIIQTGIKEVFLPVPDLDNAVHKFDKSVELYRECGVKVNEYSGDISTPVWDET